MHRISRCKRWQCRRPPDRSGRIRMWGILMRPKSLGAGRFVTFYTLGVGSPAAERAPGLRGPPLPLTRPRRRPHAPPAAHTAAPAPTRPRRPHGRAGAHTAAPPPTHGPAAAPHTLWCLSRQTRRTSSLLGRLSVSPALTRAESVGRQQFVEISTLESSICGLSAAAKPTEHPSRSADAPAYAPAAPSELAPTGPPALFPGRRSTSDTGRPNRTPPRPAPRHPPTAAEPRSLRSAWAARCGDARIGLPARSRGRRRCCRR